MFYQKLIGKHTYRYIKIANGDFRVIQEDIQGDIWALNKWGHIVHFKPSQKKLYQIHKRYSQNLNNPNGMQTSTFKSLFIDHTGMIWIGAYGAGIYKLNPYSKKFSHYKGNGIDGSIKGNIIRTIYKDSNGTLWIGTRGGGLHWMSKKDFDENYTNFNHIKVKEYNFY